VEQSDSVKNLAAALVKVQAKLKPIKRNAENPFLKSSYVDLAALSETVLPLLTANGLAVVQGGSGAALETLLVHESGEWISTSLPMPAESNPQKLGSTVTYFRRYALAALVGAVAEGEDDDGNAASHPPARSASAPPPAHRPAPASEARPAAPAAPPASGGSPACSGTDLNVEGFIVTNGVNKAGNPWTRYSATFSDGTKASTFDTKYGALLQSAYDNQTGVVVAFEKSGNFTNITSVTESSVPF